MQLQQSGFSRSSSTSCQSAACKLLLGSVWSALGRTGHAGGVKDIAAAMTPQLIRILGNALDRVSQQLESQGVNPAHVRTLVGRFNQELSDALSMAHRP
jgi:type IV secretory pathway TrbL component